MEIASAFVSLIPSARDFGPKLESEVGGQTKSAGKRLGAGFGKAFALAGGAIAALGIGSFVKTGVESLARIERINAQTAAVIKSTGGVAGVTAKHIENLAGRLENLTATEAESTQEGANLLATFTNIRNGVGKGNKVFDQATRTLVDMSRAMGSEPRAAAVQLGKALNDPIKGVTALSKVGVSFTEDQKATIKSLVEGGDTMKAQKIILAELKKEFGGSGVAFAQTTQGQVELAKHAFGTLQETITSGLLPPLGRVATFSANALNGLAEKWPAIVARAQGVVAPVLDRISAALGGKAGVQGAAKTFAGVFQANVLPVLQTAGNTFRNVVLPAVIAFGSYVGSALLPAAQQIGQIFATRVLPILSTFAQFLYGTAYPAVVGIATAVAQNLRPVFDSFASTLTSKVLPGVDGALGTLQKLQPTVQQVVGVLIDAAGGALKFGSAIIGTVGPAVIGLVGALAQHKTIILAVLAAWAGYKAVTTVIGAYRGAIAAVTVAKQAYAFATYGMAAADATGAARAGTFLGVLVTKTTAIWASVTAITASAAAMVRQTAATVAGFVVQKTVAITTGAWTAAQWLLNAALTANPIGLVIAAVAGLVVGLVVAYKKSDTFRGVVDKVFGVLKKVWGILMDNKQAFLVLLGPIGLVGAALITAYKKSETFRNILDAVRGALGSAVGAIVDFGGNVVDGGRKVGEFATKVGQKIGDVVGFFVKLPGRITGAIGDAGSMLLQTGKDIIQGLLDGLDAMIGKVTDKLQFLTDKIPDWKGPASRDKVLLRPVGQLIIRGLVDGLEDGMPGVKRSLGNATGAIKKLLTKGVSRKLINTYLDNGLKGLVIDWAAVVGVKGKGAEKALDAMRSRLEKSLEKLRSAAQKKVDGLQSTLDGMKSFASGVAGAFRADLFGGSLTDFFNTGLTSNANLRAVLAAFKKLIRGGYNKGFLSSLIQSGNAGLILELASADSATVKQAQDVFGMQNTLSNQLGTVAAEFNSGKTFKGVEDRLDRANKKLDELPERIGKQVGKSLNGAASKGKRNQPKGGKAA